MTAPPIDARSPTWSVTPQRPVGVVYVATGRRFADEARDATAQLKRTNPALPVCLVTDQPDYLPAFWDDRVLVSHPHFGFRDKILMGLCPYERFLYLDTDTFVAADLADVFTLLERFDFVGHQLFEGHDCPLPGVSDAFCEFNGGVLGFRRSPALEGFFARWLANYDAFYAQNAAGAYHYSNASDQKSLRLTVYQSQLRVGVLGPEYNFTPQHLDFACARVSIIHGRGHHHLEDIERRLNARLVNRVYVPRLDAVIADDTAGPELRRLWWMTTLQLFRRAGRRLTPLALRDWLRQNRLFRSLFLRNRFTEATPASDPKWHEPDAKKN